MFPNLCRPMLSVKEMDIAVAVLGDVIAIYVETNIQCELKDELGDKTLGNGA